MKHSSTASLSIGLAVCRQPTRDLIITAVLAVALGILLIAWTVVYEGPGTALLTSLGANLLYGVYFLPGILVPYVVRKPGTALLASFLTAAVELMGTQWGLPAIIYGLLQGLGAEVVFASRGWKDYRLIILMIASVVSAAFGFVFEYWQYAYVLLRLPSALILAGWLGKALADALARSGVLRGMALTRKP
jgi:energy-coupling factor transport system substrate-specific component